MTPQPIKMNAATGRKIVDYLASMDEADRQARVWVAGPQRRGCDKALKAQLQVQARDLAARVQTGGHDSAGCTLGAHAARPRGRLQCATVVDAGHKPIVAFDLTNEGNDLQQLHPMAVQGNAAVVAGAVTVVADTGYSNGEHGTLCEQDKITAVVPRPETSIRRAANTPVRIGSATPVRATAGAARPARR